MEEEIERQYIGEGEYIRIRLYNRRIKRVRLIMWLDKPYKLQIYGVTVYSPYYNIDYQQCDQWQKQKTTKENEEQPMKYRVQNQNESMLVDMNRLKQQYIEVSHQLQSEYKQ